MNKHFSYQSEIGALGWPHGGSPHAQEYGGGYEGVVTWVELSSYVGGVAQHTQG